MTDKIELNAAIRAASILVTYHTSKWTGVVSDSAAARAASEASGAPVSAYRVGKNLMDGHDVALKAVVSAQENGRRVHQAMTLAWGMSEGSRGPRVLATARWMEYMKAIGAAKTQFEKALQKFIADYPNDMKAAQSRLNLTSVVGLYPSPADIASHFDLKIDFAPIPEGTQFTGLPPQVAEQLASSYENRMATRVANAMADGMARLEEAVGNVYGQLVAVTEEKPCRMRQAAIDRAIEVCVLVETFNFSSDLGVTDIVQRVRQALGGKTSNDLNTGGPGLQTATAASLQSVLQQINNWKG